MLKPTAALAATLATFCAFTGCSDLGDSGPRPLATEPDYVGEYSVQQDRILMTTVGDTLSYCDGSERKVLAQPTETDTLEFHLEGDRLKVFNAPESEGAGGGMAPVVRISWEASKVGGAGSPAAGGLEGHWRILKFEHHVVSGVLTDSLLTGWERRMKAWRRGNALGISEIEFKDGRAYARSDIRWGELFVAEWNGELDPEVRTRDAGAYDIEVKALDRYAVEMKGRITGETVRISFLKNGDRTYSSDRSGHMAYQTTKEPASCPGDPDRDWFESFKAENPRKIEAP